MPRAVADDDPRASRDRIRSSARSAASSSPASSHTPTVSIAASQLGPLWSRSNETSRSSSSGTNGLLRGREPCLGTQELPERAPDGRETRAGNGRILESGGPVAVECVAEQRDRLVGSGGACRGAREPVETSLWSVLGRTAAGIGPTRGRAGEAPRGGRPSTDLEER
jgi:hypothetical protein